MAPFGAMSYELWFGSGTDNGEVAVRLVPDGGNSFAVRCAAFSVATIAKDKITIKNAPMDGRARKMEDGLGESLVQVSVGDFLRRGPATLTFRNSRLVRLSRKGTEADKSKDLKLLTALSKKPISLAKSWIRLTPEQERQRKALWWGDGGGRLRLGYFNPNATGTLFAEIAALLAGLALVGRRKWVIALGTTGSIAALTGLLMTGSRGSFIAVGVGIAAVGAVIWGRRLLKIKTLVIGGCAIAVIAVGLYFSPFGHRFIGGLFEIDKGNVQRLNAWAAAPAMMAAASEGWGEEPGRAYCDWFQNLGDEHRLCYLVNSHLTWMVQHGRLFRVSYCAVWFATFALLIGLGRHRTVAVSLGVISTFAVGMWFSTVGIFPSLWILPGIGLAVMMVEAVRHGGRKLWIGVAVMAVIGGGAASGVEALGRSGAESDVPIVRRINGMTIVGDGEIKNAIVTDFDVLAGGVVGHMGHEVRAFLQTHPEVGALALVDDPARLPDSVRTLVLAGWGAKKYLQHRNHHVGDGKYCHAERTILLSPPFPPHDVPFTLSTQTQVSLMIGEFAAERDHGYSKPQPWVRIIPGCELYIPNWLEVML